MNDPLAYWQKHLLTCPEKISYSSNAEFREHLRQIFGFDCTKTTEFGANTDESEIDTEHEFPVDPDDMRDPTQAELDETEDELAYDSEAMSKGTAAWYLFTEDHPDFLDIYTNAAYKMISTNPEVGHCVVCGYQTFGEYYDCVRSYLLTGKPSPASIAYLVNYFK